MGLVKAQVGYVQERLARLLDGGEGDAANVASLCGVRGDREAAGQAGLAGRGSSEGASSRRVDVADALQGLVVDASAAGDVVRQEDVLQGIQLERDGMK